MDSQVDSAMKYTDFTDLEEPTLAMPVIVQDLSCTDWKLIFTAIDSLRSILKYNWDEFSSAVETTVPLIVEHSDSPRSNISKNSLLLISECFLDKRTDNEFLVSQFLPVLFSKSKSEKGFIRSVAKQGLKNIGNNCVSLSTASQLKEFCHNKSGLVCELAFATLKPMLYQLSPLDSVYLALDLLETKRSLLTKETGLFLLDLQEKWTGIEKLPEDIQQKIQMIKKPPLRQTQSLREYIFSQKKSMTPSEP